MQLNDVVGKLVQIHQEYQRDGGFPDSESVISQCRPLDDLQGFESDLIPEIVRRLARELGHPLEEGVRVKNIYVSQDRTRKLSIEETARRFADKYLPKGCLV